MRVAILSLHVGGMMHYAASLANSLAQGGRDEVAVFCQDPAPAKLFHPAVRVFRYRVPQWLTPGEIIHFLRAWSTMRRLTRDILAWQPDVLHVNSGHIYYFAFLPRLARRIPMVSSIHDITPHPGERRPFERLKLGPLLRHSRAIFVHGDELRSQALARWNLPAERVTVLPMGFFNPLRPWASGVPENPFQVLFFGRLRAYKGLDVMLEAWPKVTAQAPQARLLVAGEGDLNPYTARFAACGQSVEVRNTFLSEPECARLFETSAVVVAPYIEASQSGIVFLAASFGKPVVASRIGAIPEAVEDGIGGLLVPAGDPGALAAALIRMLQEPETRKSMGRHARENLDRNHGFEQTSRRLHAVYEAVLPPTS